MLYQFARLGKELIDALTLNRNGSHYTCPVCKQEMISKVEGRIKERHFAHKAGHTPLAEGHDETYLHLMAKNLFYLAFRRCRRENLPFTVNVPLEKTCPNAMAPIALYSPCRASWGQMVNLCALFDDIRTEKRDGNFIPDISLLSSATGLTCWIEVFVTHAVDKNKQEAGVPILELQVKDKNHLAAISSADIPLPMIRAYFPEALTGHVDFPSRPCCQFTAALEKKHYQKEPLQYPDKDDVFWYPIPDTDHEVSVRVRYDALYQEYILLINFLRCAVAPSITELQESFSSAMSMWLESPDRERFLKMVQETETYRNRWDDISRDLARRSEQGR